MPDAPPDAPPASGPLAGHDRLEVAAAVILGFAILGIAWAGLQSSLWGGIQAKATTQSVLLRSEANDQFQEADAIKSLDQTLFVQFLSDCTEDELDDATAFACDQIIGTLSEPGGEAVDAWSQNDDAFNPFENDTYYDALYATGEEDLAESEEQFAKAGQANTNGDRYETGSSSLSIVLFLGGISLVLAWRRLRLVLVIGAGIVLAWAGIYVLSLPVA